VPPIRPAVAFLSIAVAASAAAQSDSLQLQATLAGWAEDTWLRLLDRDAARDGRLSDRGILQRFNSTIDPDYQINLIRARRATGDSSLLLKGPWSRSRRAPISRWAPAGAARTASWACMSPCSMRSMT
jgi:hypothetical protein